jgi:hypothetical protein
VKKRDALKRALTKFPKLSESWKLYICGMLVWAASVVVAIVLAGFNSLWSLLTLAFGVFILVWFIRASDIMQDEEFEEKWGTLNKAIGRYEAKLNESLKEGGGKSND